MSTTTGMQPARDSMADAPDLNAVHDEQTKDDLSEDGSSPGSSGNISRPEPSQKRRRVARACDECRRKKIKCDGSQPCTHCVVYSYDCTYDQPSQRRRNPGPAYVEALEQKLQRAEALLKTYNPTIDLNDPTLDTSTSQSVPPSASASKNSSISTEVTPNQPGARPQAVGTRESSGTIESMVKATGQLDLDDRGRWEYYGFSSGLSWLRRIRDQFGESAGVSEGQPRSLTYMEKGRHIGQDFESPQTPAVEEEASFISNRRKSYTIDLPSRSVARQLCASALDDASAILNICYKPHFYRNFDRIYDLSPDDYEAEDNRFLPLLYSVLALGCLFSSDEESELEQHGYKSATHQGYEYFWAAREILDMTNIRDIVQLQAVIFMLMFLQCSAKLSTCYSYIGIALRSALRMGLHRSFRDSFTPIEAEVRKRAFWVIRKMDIYVGAMLGLPLILSDDDVDQDLPAEVDDDHITLSGITPMPPGIVPLAAASNANFRLSLILFKIVRSIYPTKGFQNTEQKSSRSYSVQLSIIRELEGDLQKWMEDLPSELKPGGVRQPWHVGPIQQLLRLAYAHAQIMLYRPFLHYVSSRRSSTPVDQRSYACAAACVSVARNIIHITAEMMREKYLVGSYWFTMYTAFFAVLSLVYFVVENADSPTAQDIYRDAEAGKEVLAILAKRSMAADRCNSTLNGLWGAIPASVQVSTTAKQPSRKREAPTNTEAVASQDSSSRHTHMAPPPAPAPYPKPLRMTASQPQGSSQSDVVPSQSAGTNKPTLLERRTMASGQRMFMPLSTSDSSSSSGSYNLSPTSQRYQADMQQQQNLQRRSSHPPQFTHQQQQPNHYPHHHSAQQGAYPFQSGNMQYQGNFMDLSALMFPSADPFAYPVPPMTILEQQSALNPKQHGSQGTQRPTDASQLYHQTQQPQATDYSHDFIPASTAAADTVSADEHIDVQLFGPLPSYLQPSVHEHAGMQHQSHQEQPRTFQHGEHTSNHSAHLGGEGSMWEQMQGIDGFNYEDIFGNEEEWRGTLP